MTQTDFEYMRKILAAQHEGYCWRCGTWGNKLQLDPMIDSDSDTLVVALCKRCCRERTNIQARYRAMGVWLQPQRRQPAWQRDGQGAH